MKLDIQGIIPPMVTAFTWDTEELDVKAIREETEFLIQSGVHGICIGGSTGEGAGFSEEEVYTLCKTVVEQVKDRVPVIGGIIADSTAEAVRKSKAAKEAGVSSLQVTPPHYLWTPTTGGLVQHFQRIGEATKLPILIYNVVPWVPIDVHAMTVIVENAPWVAGVKQSGGDMHKVADMMHQLHDRVTVVTGIDDMLYPAFCLGVDGAITCMLAVLPEATIDLWNKVQAGDHAGAKALHDRLLPVWRSIEGPDMPFLAKTAIELMGRKVGPARSPILPPSDEKREEIRNRLVQAGFAVSAVNRA
ncbi:dihydrodipicolinate synthase family protein [Alicyclobacillus fastidiosus]|uniref:Dihydrodipicolinate synthase family protein n=1 Tax=Alicyclobacillus fastidiosus TaxID=392011 RepID=A0ABY6ZFZ5_9BACL|nr:dihydrodipicolinate synthase family protein [Alicyclobacillus fastidiosus]WAH41784.1 dihydrodipicolinate synthase family protein [Alicyclobacillus fastidiosus]GMA63479.1 4-hydroxy-tetrahydrodipicolinate synthase [Alicyclobacillus fastidiosus]